MTHFLIPKHMVIGIEGDPRSVLLGDEWFLAPTGRHYHNPNRRAMGTEHTTNHGDTGITWCRWVKSVEKTKNGRMLGFEQTTSLVYSPEALATEYARHGCTREESENAWCRYGRQL